MANPIKAIKAVKKIKPTGMKGRGTKSTTVSKPKSNVKVVPNFKKVKPKDVDAILKSLPKAPPMTSAQKARTNNFIEKEINKLKKQRGK
jgi:hypothetical protein